MGQVKIPVDLIMSRLAEGAEHFQTRAHKASEVLLEDLDTDLATTPYEIVYTQDRLKLKHYKPEKPLYNTPSDCLCPHQP